jgi:adenylate kinase
MNVNIIITGKPGSGKGTHAKLLADKLNIPHIDMGNILRNLSQIDETFGRVLKGKLIPDDLANDIIREELSQDKYKHGFILDGYPRTLDQAKFLNENFYIDYLIDLKVSDRVVFERLLDRGRQDDKVDIIKDRLETYEKQTKPIVKYFEELLDVIVVDGSQPIEIVQNNIILQLQL